MVGYGGSKSQAGNGKTGQQKVKSVDTKHVISRLIETRAPFNKSELPDRPGVYAIFLGRGISLRPFAGAGGMLYVGKSESSLRNRDLGQHFRSGATSRSTLRRSLGAILKDRLGLRAVPRGWSGIAESYISRCPRNKDSAGAETSSPQDSASLLHINRNPTEEARRDDSPVQQLPSSVDINHYRFMSKDEDALTAWMRDNLEIGYTPIIGPASVVRQIEERLLEELNPPLNIDRHSTGRNPHAALLLELRAKCGKEASFSRLANVKPRL